MVPVAAPRLCGAAGEHAARVNGVDEPGQPRRRIVVRRVQRIRRGEDAAVVVGS